MKYSVHILAVISFILVLILAVCVYNINNKVSFLEHVQGSGVNTVSSNLVKLETTVTKMQQDIAEVKQNNVAFAQTANDVKQNAAAIEDIKKRINEMVDLIK